MNAALLEPAVGVPPSVVARALQRRELQRRLHERHCQQLETAVQYAQRACERLVRSVREGRVRVGTAELGPFDCLPTEKFVEARSALAEVFVVYELRSGLAGRLRSLCSKVPLTDPTFVEAVTSGLKAAASQHGLRLRFHPHWVQRFIPTAAGGYYEILGFQLLARVMRAA